jgi:hypothetical protein
MRYETTVGVEKTLAEFKRFFISTITTNFKLQNRWPEGRTKELHFFVVVPLKQKH